MPKKYKRKLGTKKKASDLRRHFRNRLSRRYGIELTRNDIESLKSRFHSNEAGQYFRLDFNQSNTRTVWFTKLHGQIVRIVYNKKLNEFVTALPKASFEVKNDGKVETYDRMETKKRRQSRTISQSGTETSRDNHIS